MNTATTVRLEDCIIEDNVEDGVSVNGGSKATLSGCTITRNGHGVLANGSTTEVKILENNDLSGNRNGPTYTSDGARIIRSGQ